MAHRKVFVGGLHYGTDDASLRRYFSKYGAIESAQVRRGLCGGGGLG